MTTPSTLLTKTQRLLLVLIVASTCLLLANSAYLWITSPAASSTALEETRFETSTYGMVGTGAITAETDNRHVSLPPFYQWMLLLHIGGGLLLLVFALAFIVWHVPAAWQRNNPRAIRMGAALTVAVIGLAISGLFILTEANSEANRWIFHTHQVLALALPFLYLGHRLMTYWPLQQNRVIAAFAGVVLLVVFFLGIHFVQDQDAINEIVFDAIPSAHASTEGEPLALDENPGDPFIPFQPGNLGSEDSAFFPAPSTTFAGGPIDRTYLTGGDHPSDETLAADLQNYGFLTTEAVGAETCARCHAGTTEQWMRSAHRFSSFNNPFYKASIELLRREENGFERSQWCASCHDPVPLFTGMMSREIDATSLEAQSGITCLSCHAIDTIHGKEGNGNYNISDAADSDYLFADLRGGVGQSLHDLLLKSKPTVHKNQMLKRFHRSSEFCMPCHKVSLDVPVNRYKWLRGQNDYDNWHNSGVSLNAARTFYLPAEKRLCQDCHMPMEDVRLPDVSATNGQVRSHTFLSANTALPYVRGDEESLREVERFLQNSGLHVDVFTARIEGEDTPLRLLPDTRLSLNEDRMLQVDVVVRNMGVGHTFPSGTLDSNECWIQFEVTHADGTLHARAGELLPNGRVNPAAHFYKALFVNRLSEPSLIRNAQDFHAPVYVRVIGPGTADVVRFRFPAPETDAFQVQARLMWRKFTSSFSEFVQENERFPYIENQGEPFALPITVIDESNSIRFESSDDPFTFTVANVEPSDDPRADWMRMNDYGIAHFLQEDYRIAEWAFENVDRLARDKPDGPRNLARIALQQGNIEEAYALLQECEVRNPGDAQSAWFWGMARMEEGLYDEAVQAFQRVIAFFPEDRMAWKQMGRSLYLDGQFKEALDAYQGALRIDPEDSIAHYHRMLIYRALGRTEEADEAQRAFDKYKDNEEQQQFTQAYRLANPLDNKAAQSIIVYDLAPLTEGD